MFRIGENELNIKMYGLRFLGDMMTKVPAANISENAEHFHVELAAPGLKKEDFRLKLERDVLSISVELVNEDQQQERNYAKREYSYSSFVRSFTLPEMADQNGIEAKYSDGVLCIYISKREDAKVQSLMSSWPVM